MDCRSDALDLPFLLSRSLLKHLSVRIHKPHPALIPYSVNAPLWSDGAHKERFLAVPGLLGIDMTPSRGWKFATPRG